MRCTVKDVKTVLTELRTAAEVHPARITWIFRCGVSSVRRSTKPSITFSRYGAENKHAVPRFLWNAKMRFGKTFTAYQLAKKLGAKRLLVLTFKPPPSPPPPPPPA